MFPFRSKQAEKRPYGTLIAVVGALVLYEAYSWRSSGHGRPLHGQASRLEAPRRADDAYGRASDLVLSGVDGTSVTIAAAPDVAGHRPLLGAIVDVATVPGDVPDPLIWLRTVFVDPGGVHDLPVRPPQPFECDGGAAGVREYGALGVALTTEVCVGDRGLFRLSTKYDSLPAGGAVADEVNVGSLPVVVAHDGAAWNEERDTPYFAFSHGGTAVLVESDGMHVSRTFSHFGAETFPSPVVARYRPERVARRTLRVARGDVLTAIGLLPSANRLVDLTFGAGRGGEATLLDGAGRELATGTLARGERRVLRLPADLGTALRLRDDRGVVTDEHVAVPEAPGTTKIVAGTPAVGTLSLSYRDASGAPVPVHALFQGNRWNDAPEPRAAEGRVVAAGRSLYLVDGHATFAVVPGPYRITASHGPTWSLSQRDVVVEANRTVNVEDELHAVVDTAAWTSGDFHLHSAPSPDSVVSLRDRVSCLVCEGVELAVATDHNRVTDLGPAVKELAVQGRIATLPGVEASTVGQRFGHFNAYPLPLPAGAPEEGVPVYFDRRPADIFASARSLGARVLQVNHARMDPGIGYFDLAHVDPNTGRSDPVFSTDFDVLEAFNGMWIERYEKVREGPRDVVALARRGKRVAVTGNSDSHKLLFEEAGYPRTFVHVPRDPVETRSERVLAALLAGDTTVTSGPFVEIDVDGKRPGTLVRPGPEGVLHVHVRVTAPAWVPVERFLLLRDDVPVEKEHVPGPPTDGVRFERTFEVRTEGHDSVIVAWAEASTRLPDVVPYENPLSIGFTGPVYVDGDGDGRLLVPPAPDVSGK
ncbi:MAG TPA: CehA/McbA family metallohydrolase [Polyangiaceae bacterium]|nr:CehA/McbA family metallohydrolase [Polyangiaceae bacterium]